MVKIKNKEQFEKRKPSRYSKIEWFEDSPYKLKDFEDLYLVGYMIKKDVKANHFFEKVVIVEGETLSENKEYKPFALYQIQKFRLMSQKDIDNAEQK